MAYVEVPISSKHDGFGSATHHSDRCACSMWRGAIEHHDLAAPKIGRVEVAVGGEGTTASVVGVVETVVKLFFEISVVIVDSVVSVTEAHKDIPILPDSIWRIWPRGGRGLVL